MRSRRSRRAAEKPDPGDVASVTAAACGGDPLIGSVIDKYSIVRMLGKGGMGAVYEARHLQLARRFAIKLLLPHVAAEGDALRRFENEARAAGGLEHGNVAAVTDLGRTAQGSPYLVMEFLEGEDCGQLVRRLGSLPARRATDVVTQACRGLGAAHAAGIVHRDVKPENLFVARAADGGDWVKVLDFGIAKLRDLEADGLTRTGTTLGTALYMSPEQARGAAHIDERTDVWSLGVVLYQLLSGRRPFAGRQFLDVTHQILSLDPVPLKQLCPELPDALTRVVEHAMRKDVAERLPSVAAFAEALAPFNGNWMVAETTPAQVAIARDEPRVNPGAMLETLSLVESAVVSVTSVPEQSVPVSLAVADSAFTSTKPVRGIRSAPLDLLELHADRRRAGVPTVSLLRGTLASGQMRFRTWADGVGLSVNTARCGEKMDPLSQWLATSASSGLRAHAIEIVAEAAQVSPSLVSSLVETPCQDAELVFRRAAEAGERQAYACWVLGHRVRAASDPVAAFASLIVGIPRQSWLLLVDEATEQAASQLRLVTQLVERFPEVTVAVVMNNVAFQELLAEGGLRWQTLLLEAVIRVPGAEEVPEPGGLPPATRSARAELVRRGISPATLREFDAIATHGAAGKPRSSEEAFLFSILAEHAETCGWFVLNRKLGFKFGRKPAEVDICSVRLCIAIEVDGSFHQTPEAQERDRRKDDLLREHGYTVLRVATDRLCSDLNAVLAQILGAVREKKRRLWEV